MSFLATEDYVTRLNYTGAADIHVDSGESGIDADSPTKKAKTEEVDIDAAME